MANNKYTFKCPYYAITVRCLEWKYHPSLQLLLRRKVASLIQYTSDSTKQGLSSQYALFQLWHTCIRFKRIISVRVANILTSNIMLYNCSLSRLCSSSRLKVPLLAIPPCNLINSKRWPGIHMCALSVRRHSEVPICYAHNLQYVSKS